MVAGASCALRSSEVVIVDHREALMKLPVAYGAQRNGMWVPRGDCACRTPCVDTVDWLVVS
jgi:hypothetical protein